MNEESHTKGFDSINTLLDDDRHLTVSTFRIGSDLLCQISPKHGRCYGENEISKCDWGHLAAKTYGEE